MRVIFMGTPDFAVPSLHALSAAGHEIIAVYSQPPRKAGRGKKTTKSPVLQAAAACNLPVFYPASFQDPDEQALFKAFQADIAIVVAYGLLLPQAILTAPKLGCINIHASLLPKWRGAAPIQRAIMAGDTLTGICLMQMDAGLDSGPVLSRHEMHIAPDETAGQLSARLSHLGAEHIVKALSVISELTPTPQNTAGMCYADKIQKQEAALDWSEPAVIVDRKIRALSPFPGAWFAADGTRYKVLRSRVEEGIHAPPGTVLPELMIACAGGAVHIDEIQPAGKAPMTKAAFLNGYKLPKVL